LAALIEESLKANPDIRQMSEVAAASKETIRSAKALDDPDLLISSKDICLLVPGNSTRMA
jgi:outer membrane protein TolC